jgi:hypothetical protein
MVLESTKPMIEISIRYLPVGKKRSEHKTHLTATCIENVGASTSQNPMGLHGLLQG